MSTTAVSTRQDRTIALAHNIDLHLTPHLPGRRWMARLTWGPSTIATTDEPMTQAQAEAWGRRWLRTLGRPLTRWTREQLETVFIPEVARRGGDTTVGDGGKNAVYGLRVQDVTDDVVLLGAVGWYRVSSTVGDVQRPIDYIAGVDDNGPWATRAPRWCPNVARALKRLIPVEVTRREHVRQGDVYLVRYERATATTASGVIDGSHLWDATTRTLTHEAADGELPHALVTAPADWPGVRVMQQSAMNMRYDLVD